MDRLEEDDFLFLEGEVFCGVLLLHMRHEREADDGTNAKPSAEGAKRKRKKRATVDFIIVKG